MNHRINHIGLLKNLRLLLKLGVDDPVDAVAIHGGGGLLGILAAPIFMENGKYPFFLLFEKEKVI